MQKHIYDFDSYNFEKLNKYHFVNQNKITEDYWNLSYLYRVALEMYLDSILNLTKYDSLLEKQLKIINISKENEPMHFCLSKFKFIYLRNNMFIERLEESELEILKIKWQTKLVDNELLSLIAKTYKKIIAYKEDSNNTMHHYEAINDGVYVLNNALLIIIYYDLFKLEQENDYIEKMMETQQYIFQIKNDIIETSKNVLDIPIEVQLVRK